MSAEVELAEARFVEWIKGADDGVVVEVLAACAPELLHGLVFWHAYGQDDAIRPRPEDLGRYADAWREEIDRRTDGYVYVLAGGGFHKIGRAKKPFARARTLAIQLPYPVELVRVVASDDYVEAERFLHDWFAAERRNGEWFELSEHDLLELSEMTEHGRFDGWQMERWSP